MSSAERLEKLGRLEQLKQQAIALSVELHALGRQIHRATDWTLTPLEAISLQEIAMLMQQYQDKLVAHRARCQELRHLAEDLGLPMPHTEVRRT